MKKWPTKALGDICEINPKLRRVDTSSIGQDVTFVPMSAVDEITASITRPEVRLFQHVSRGYTPFKENDVLFAKITPCMENGKIAIARNLRGGLGFGSTEFHVIRSNGSVLPSWVLAFLRTQTFRNAAQSSFTGSAGQQRVPASFLKGYLIPIPPLPEQERIVRLLDEADELRKRRAQADKRMADFIPALFYKMFGDPVTNPKGWPVKKLGEICNIRIGRTPRRDQPRYWGGHSVWVTIGELRGGVITTSKEHISDAAVDECMSDPIPAGTLLFSFKLSIGKTAVAGVPLYTNEAIAALPIRDPQTLSRAFLHRALTSQSRDGGANGAVLGKVLNKKKVTQIEIPLPPLAEQERFERLVETSEDMIAAHGASRDRAEVLFQSMLHRAFEWEL